MAKYIIEIKDFESAAGYPAVDIGGRVEGEIAPEGSLAVAVGNMAARAIQDGLKVMGAEKAERAGDAEPTIH